MQEYSLNCVVGRGGGGGGEIPKGGRAGRARSLGIWPRGGEITGGRNPWDTGIRGVLTAWPRHIT